MSSPPPATQYFIQGKENWPTPNLIDPPVASTLLPSFEYLLLSLSTLLIGGRLVSRGYLLKSLGLDDIFIVFALLFALIVTVSNMLLLSAGFGRHTWDVNPKDVNTMLFHLWLSQWTPAISTMFTKLSIVCFYLRFVMGKTARHSCYATMAFTVMWSTGVAIAWVARCVPANVWWEGGNGQCMSPRWLGILTAWQMGLNLCTHVILLCLPMSTLWKLQMHWGRKLGLVVLLGFGLTCCVFGSIRLKATYATIKMEDPSWTGHQAIMLNILEVQGGIIYACVPFLKPITLRLVSPVRSIVQRKSKLFSSTAASASTTAPSIAIAKSVTIHNHVECGPRAIRIPSPLDDIDDDLENARSGSLGSVWSDEKLDVGVQSECVSVPSEVPTPMQLTSQSLVSMSTIATDGSGMLKAEEDELSGLTPAQIPRPGTGRSK